MNIQSYFKISKALMNTTMKILPHGSVQVSFRICFTLKVHTLRLAWLIISIS